MQMNSGFDFVASPEARVLILGSMPGVASLEAHQYYAHPRNLFWHFMQQLFDIDRELPYEERLMQLQAQRIALWDVAHQCERIGSLDSNIRADSVTANDFTALFRAHRHIKALFFNGRKAAELYHRLVLPALAEPWRSLPCTTLPSTSPANASITRQEKLSQWLQVRESLLR